MGAILSAGDIHDLTGYTRAVEQRRALDDYGIPYKTIGNRTIVLSAHVEAWVEGRPVPRIVEPDFASVK